MFDDVYRDTLREKTRDWYKLNADRQRLYRMAYVIANKDSVNEANKRCRLKNPEMYKSYRVNRKSKLRNAKGSISSTHLKRQIDRQNGECYWCGTPLIGIRYHADHLVPISKGGTNEDNNVVLSCEHCNCSKGAKTPDEFVGYLLNIKGNRDLIAKMSDEISKRK